MVLTNQIDEILLYAQQLIAANRPGERDYKSVKNFMWNKKPLMEGDAEFIHNKDDLVTLRPGRETAWLDILVEQILKIFPRKPIQYLFCSKVGQTNNLAPNSLIGKYRRQLGSQTTPTFVTSQNLVLKDLLM